MHLIRYNSSVIDHARGGVVAIGNFDGLHKGHQLVISEARSVAEQLSKPFNVLTFRPHPRRFFRPNEKPFRLTPFRAKIRAISDLGVDNIIVCRFNNNLANLSAKEFVEDILIGDLEVSHVTVGHDFTFGNKRSGNPMVLKNKSLELDFGITIVEPARDSNGNLFSSSAIRQYVSEGKMQEVAMQLGRTWEIEGRVIKGDQRGRTIGFPTANIELIEYIQPAKGVYSVRAGILYDRTTKWFDGVANFGDRPTVEGARLLLETHLFDFEDDLYGKNLRVGLVDYLRPERKFESFEALKDQIKLDCETARKNLAKKSLNRNQ
ncbi:MAG: riboflavin biosynthesis protein RibF [Alphaproteobacteria bacterium]|jgi:riboflavin kinase/FMN adenylyltransferase|nr:riboflavin biosynthesis protein RibF [Alphaproteobacteria bacterium]PPR14441.1 MAG: Riboflavin biosynthesis protein RibF [Alphaproteobacteria bacterium MarineAlpha12_Bin1]|tara:strand:- start:22090 stop:23049 length:960 start_codon:yes stop_codon:yes gene_type:complete